ncbi:MAG: AAA family ATPase [Deltaproteobacteria bacterium]|nr:AAA family ATPase [Deltaproteobacteria bacterium]
MQIKEKNEELQCFSHFGLRRNPFPVVPDQDNFYVCDHIDRIVHELVHGITTRKGFLVFTGEVGLGKTTISRRILSILDSNGVETSLVFHTFYQETELLREINRDFGLTSDSLVLSDQMRALGDFLLQRHREGKNCAMIIDDAQNLSHKSLELIRMISNLETHREKLVQILLIGQPELDEKLNSPALRQLKSRVMIREQARPLSLEELRGYIMFKLYMAGNGGKISLTQSALRRIHKLTGGNFRQINNIMERCIYVAFLRSTCRITRAIVNEAYADLNPQRSRLIRRIAWAALPSAAALYLAVAPFLPSEALKPLLIAREEPDSAAMASRPKSGGEWDQQEAADVAEAYCSPGILWNVSREFQDNTDNAHAVRAFLDAYGLAVYGDAFERAMGSGIFRPLADRIYADTGYRMVQLHQLPPNVQTRYDVLRICSQTNQSQRFFLFWKPPVHLHTFYYGYRGDEIRTLEHLLAQAGLYNYALDGVVGRRLMKAVNWFQRDCGLTVTGFPDDETVFLLCHQKRKADA